MGSSESKIMDESTTGYYGKDPIFSPKVEEIFTKVNINTEDYKLFCNEIKSLRKDKVKFSVYCKKMGSLIRITIKTELFQLHYWFKKK